MHSIYVSLMAAGLATLAHAQDYTAPTDATWGPLLLPDLTHPVTQGKEFTVTWDPEDHPTDGVTVSLVVCKGPSTNCVPQDTAIATGLSAAAKSYTWDVPCDLTPGTQATETGYGMLVIVDGTGEFQYSTQFSVLENEECSGGKGSPSTSSAIPTETATQSHGGGFGNSSYTLSTSYSGHGSGYGWDKTSTASDATATYDEIAPTTTVAATSDYPTAPIFTSSQSAPAASATAFGGGAAQLGWNAAGLVAAGAAALFAL